MTKKIQNTVRAYQALFWICLVATAACAAAMILYGISAAFFAVNEIALLLCMSLYILHKKHHYTEAVEMINTTAANIEDTQLQLVAFNEHLQALNEFTKELSAETDRTEICKLATRMLVNKFKYDSSQFWLLNPQKDCLEFISASGYNDRIINQILADRTAENEQRLLYRVLSKKKMLIVRDVDDHSDMEDNDNYLFGKLFNLISFAVMPLLVDNKAIGVITIEYQRGGTMDAGGEMKSFDERDCLLLESLINFVGDVLAKTELFQDMEQQIEERTRELTKIKQKLLRTKELAIQSEKLSSLGKMAAGVIHEINDPLNFLVNILPDLRRDLQGLETINDLTLECITEPNALSEIEAISNQYNLESHLQEMDFVFERVTNALNKSTQIARSLNVFTSASNQEEIEMTNLIEVARESTEMIPQKVLGDTKIHVREGEDCAWPVNRSEMQQVFINLVNNAIDAMEKKGTIEIWGEKKNHAVTVSVCDNGPGIPAEIQNQIFNPFFTTKPAGQSTGLGLSISAEIVRKFGGHLSVESIEGQGTCFHIRFRESI